MKRFLFTVLSTVFLGCFFGEAQVTRSNTNVSQPVPIATLPANISQFEVSGRLITQNAFVGTAAIPATQQTGNFGATASWNSMGNINFNAVTPNLTQTINGFRSQTNGRGLAWGYSTPAPGQPNAGVLSSPFIEWIGNNGVTPVVAPGNLEFKYALSSTGAAASRVPIFKMAPATGITPSFNYAEANTFIGQKQSGTFGLFGAGDTWSAIGQIITPSFITYGARQQFQGFTVNTTLIRDNVPGITTGVLDFGISPGIINPRRTAFKFRVFTDPAQPSTIKNVWQSNVGFGNMILGRQEYNAVNSATFYLSLFDGAASVASSTAVNFINRAGIYVTTDGTDVNSPADLVPSYAAIVGDASGTEDSGLNYGVLGISPSAGNGKWAGYFLGGVASTAGYASVSVRKFKIEIKEEENIIPKLMQLQPKNYYFDVIKNKNMRFDPKLQHGLISQDVEQIFPELVIDAYGPNTSKDSREDGKPMEYKGLNYIGFIPMLIKGMQELKMENDLLKQKIDALATTNTVVLSNKAALPTEIENSAFALSQNTPNPFSEKTTISYSIPASTGKAILAIFDLSGKMLQQYNLLQGKNQLTINGNTLQAGMYIYTLLADGQEVVSKRMVLTK